MVPEVESERIAGPSPYNFDYIERHTLEEVEECSSDPQAVTLKVCQTAVLDDGCDGRCELCLGQQTEATLGMPPSKEVHAGRPWIDPKVIS